MAEVDKNAVHWCVVAAIRKSGGQKPPAHDPVKIDEWLNGTTVMELLGDVGENAFWGRKKIVKETDQQLHREGVTGGPKPVRIAKIEWLGKEFEDQPVMTYAGKVYDEVTKHQGASGGGNG